MKRIIKLLFAALMFSTGTLTAQTISTIAGNGTGGYYGDGGSALSAELNGPSWLAFDAAGNLYISDAANNCIRKVSIGGIITTVAGNGTAGYTGDGGAATSSELSNPLGIAVDASGNLYVVDYGNNVVRKVNASGVISTIAGNGSPGYSGDGGAATNAQLYYPQGIALDAVGNIYIADVGNYVIRKVNTSGIISTVAGNNSPGYSGDGGAATSAQLSQKPTGVYVDATGNLYIADNWNNVIRMVNTGGSISTIAGNGTAGFAGDGSAATSAELNSPNSIYGDSLGDLYIADNLNNRIRKISTSGIINTVAGDGLPGFSGDGGLATAAEIHIPAFGGSTIFHSGRLYIADGANQRVRMTGNLFTGIGKLNNSIGITIYPNPASNMLTIDNHGRQMRELTMYDMEGRIILEGQFSRQLDISYFSSGCYIIRLKDIYNQVYVSKFVKQ